MAEQKLEIVTERDGAVLLLRLRGDLDMAAEAALTEALRAPLPSGVREVVLDCAEVPFLDSTGVRVLLEGRERALDRGVALTIRDPQPIVLQVLRVCAVAPLFGT